ncbi:VWA domain-containing protein [Dermabacteraceae bacterium TAE3-ERU27]|nr:VWA domain-containing protein [Dermabacteraceae bacterium TAE3-ERU27]
MNWQPLLSWPALIALFLPAALLCLWLVWKRPGQRLAWVRRLLLVTMLLLVAARPGTYVQTSNDSRLNADVLFVVDTTGSMAAEDGPGGKPRLEQVRKDIRELVEKYQGARFGIIAFDSSATVGLPYTTDTSAVLAWVDTMRVESTATSRGSNVDRPLKRIYEELTDVKSQFPDDLRLLYFFSDGENTDDRESRDFRPIARLLNGGAVIGYGTEQGGKMRASGLDAPKGYIKDPATGADAISRTDVRNLKRIAREMAIPYLHTERDSTVLGKLAPIKNLHSIKTDQEGQISAREDYYWIPALGAALLLLWECAYLTLTMPALTVGRKK